MEKGRASRTAASPAQLAILLPAQARGDVRMTSPVGGAVPRRRRGRRRRSTATQDARLGLLGAPRRGKPEGRRSGPFGRRISPDSPAATESVAAHADHGGRDVLLKI